MRRPTYDVKNNCDNNDNHINIDEDELANRGDNNNNDDHYNIDENDLNNDGENNDDYLNADGDQFDNESDERWWAIREDGKWLP